ncbi:MAG: hypothetical protein IGBAC_0768 [Ignavibacteriae bacterium]|nr:MAG: hypothetical protein IGBAC_0768 [Ignavibacteriota bacterium]
MKNWKKNIILFLIIFFGCDYPVPESNLSYDFLENFNKASISPGPDKVFRYQSWMKGTEGRDAMVIGVYGTVTFQLNPDEVGDELYFGLRLRNPDTAAAICNISVKANDSISVVFSKNLNTRYRAADRDWSDAKVDFSRFKNKSISVTFSVQFDGTDAWVEWSSPILLANQ